MVHTRTQWVPSQEIRTLCQWDTAKHTQERRPAEAEMPLFSLQPTLQPVGQVVVFIQVCSPGCRVHTHGEAPLSFLESVLLHNFIRTNMIPNTSVSRGELSKDIILNTGLHSVGSSLIQEKKYFSTKGNVLKTYHPSL